MNKFTDLHFGYLGQLGFYNDELLEEMSRFTKDLMGLLNLKYISSNKYSNESKLKQYFSDNLNFAKDILKNAYDEYKSKDKKFESLKNLEEARAKLKDQQSNFCHQMDIFIANTVEARGTDGLDDLTNILLWEGKPKKDSKYHKAAETWRKEFTKVAEQISREPLIGFEFPVFQINRKEWKNFYVWDKGFRDTLTRRLMDPFRYSIQKYLSQHTYEYFTCELLSNMIWKPLNDFLLECRKIEALPWFITNNYKNKTIESFQKLEEIISNNDEVIKSNTCETVDLSGIEFIWLLLIRVYKRSVIKFNEACRSNIQYEKVRILLDKYKRNTAIYRGKDPGDD